MTNTPHISAAFVAVIEARLVATKDTPNAKLSIRCTPQFADILASELRTTDHRVSWDVGRVSVIMSFNIAGHAAQVDLHNAKFSHPTMLIIARAS
jgi:hypothetical protein